MPGIVGFEEHEKSTSVNLTVENKKTEKKYMLKNNFGFGGVNVSLLLKNLIN